MKRYALPLAAVAVAALAAGTAAASVTFDQPASSPVVAETTTTTTAAPTQPAPIVAVPTTTTTAPKPVTTTTTAPKPDLSGTYACPNTMTQTNQYTAGPACTRTVADDPGPNADADQPQNTIAAHDPAYSAELDAKMCAVKPLYCEIDGSGHYR